MVLCACIDRKNQAKLQFIFEKYKRKIVLVLNGTKLKTKKPFQHIAEKAFNYNLFPKKLFLHHTWHTTWHSARHTTLHSTFRRNVTNYTFCC